MGMGTPKRERVQAPQQHLHHLMRSVLRAKKIDEQNQTSEKCDKTQGWDRVAGPLRPEASTATPTLWLGHLSPWGGFHNENDYLLFLLWK